MRNSALKFLSVGLLVGAIVGCGKGPGGLQGLCEQLVDDCKAMTTVAECTGGVSGCSDSQGDDCLKQTDCNQLLVCYASLALSCGGGTTFGEDDGGNTSAATEPTTAATEPSAGTTSIIETGDATTDGPTTAPTSEPDPTAATEVSSTTGPNPGTETTNPGTETTDPSTDPGTSDTTGGAGGDEVYGPCAMSNPPCPGDGDCLGVQDVEGNFCSPKCDAMTDCPAYSGSGMAVCALVAMGSMDPTNCVVLCMADADCPDGMTCKDVPNSMGAKACTAP